MTELNEDQKQRLDNARDMLEKTFKEGRRNPDIRAVSVEMQILPRDREEINNDEI